MKKLICSLVSAALLAVLIAGCTNNNDFSNMFGLLGSSNSSVSVDQTESLSDFKVQVAKMDLSTLQKEVDAYKTAISEKTSLLDKYQTQLNEIPLSQMLGDKAVALKNNISKATQSLSDLNKKLQVILDQINSLQK